MKDKTSIIKKAQGYLAKGHVDKAIAEWEKLIKEYPDANTYNTIGDLYLKKGDKKNAVDAFHRAADLFIGDGFSLKALALYKKILNITPADADALIALGAINEERGLTTDAIKYYLAAADGLSKEGRKEKLFEIYSKILSMSPSNISLRNKVAGIYAKEGLFQEAANEYLHIARLYEEKGEIEKSIVYYQKVLEIQPLSKEAILEINHLYEKSGNLKQAFEQIKEATTRFHHDTDICLRAVELYVMFKKFDEAKELLGKVTEVEPANIRARKLLAEIYRKEGDEEKAWAEYLPVIDEITLTMEHTDAIALLESFKDIDPLETGKRLVTLHRQLGENLKVAHELTTLGDVFKIKGMHKEALNCYREALQITPEDDSLNAKVVVELETEGVEEVITGEKTVDEALAEADIFLKYGLYEDARNILEGLRKREPENIDLHLKLKSLYLDTEDKEQAITECLILYELYGKAGETEKRGEVIEEAYTISPEDPRLITVAQSLYEEKPAPAQEGLSIEDYTEEIAESDFYYRHGFINEAKEILEKLQKLFPENEDIKQRLLSLSEVRVGEEKIEVEEEYKEFVTPGGETVEVGDAGEPALNSNVLEVFREFKKGLEKEVEEADYETHYNLGIAYKELGLIDDAIREFQISIKDTGNFVSSSTVLGICYMEKGLYSLAIDVLSEALNKIEDKGESYWAVKYDLAEAYEKNGNLREALDLYTEVYGWNSKFRAVSDKIDHIQANMMKGADQKKQRDKKDRISYL